jgi:diguanylate cyclase (GGDEF)-like protein
LVQNGRGVGVFALYAKEADHFDEEEMRLILELAGDIAFALEHLDKSEKAEYLAYYDPLTELANRSLFYERLAQQLASASHSQGKCALLVIDIARFKTINDTFGRQAGDALLRKVAERVTALVPRLLVSRVGPDQFALVVPDVQSVDELARRVEERLKDFFGAPYPVGNAELSISGKLGIAVYPEDGADAETLFRNAEAALKKAKQAGAAYLFYEQRMSERVSEKLGLESKLRRALEEEQFVLHYQPKVDLATRAVVGVEALIRWNSPEKGIVPPLHFIPLLEETGLILQVGAWALSRAARDQRAWFEQNLNAPRVAVNVSAVQLRQRDFVSIVEQAISDGRGPTAIDLEITESQVMEDIKSNIEKLKAVRELGVSVAIDDFGTGYSSLGYLAQLPVQALKIDRSFIIRMQEDPNAMTLVSTIISLAHSLRLKVVAEGVETEELAKLLGLLRCDEMQGYLISKPVPAEQLVPLLKTG